MRQSDFEIGGAKKRRNRRNRLMHAAVLLDDEDELLPRLHRRYRRSLSDARKIKLRSRHISGSTFNFNIYSEEQSLRNFRFQTHELNQIVSLCTWTAGKRKRNRYSCDPFTATCIVLRNLAFPTRSQDIEIIFGMRASAIPEIFWEVIGSLRASKAHLLGTFRSPLMARRAAMHAEAIHNKGAPLTNCVGFIDCTKNSDESARRCRC